MAPDSTFVCLNCDESIIISICHQDKGVHPRTHHFHYSLIPCSQPCPPHTNPGLISFCILVLSSLELFIEVESMCVCVVLSSFVQHNVFEIT